MKKLVLLVGSLLAVSAVASAKEVVPQPKAAPEVQVKEVIKEVPVEKVVYRDRVVEVAKAGANGTFEVSYKVPFYKFGIAGGLKDTKNNLPGFTFVERVGSLVTKAEVEVAPKHKVRAEAETSLELIPHKEYTGGDEEKATIQKAEERVKTIDEKIEKQIKALEAKIDTYTSPDDDAKKATDEAVLAKLKDGAIKKAAEEKVEEAKIAAKQSGKNPVLVPASKVAVKEMKLGYNYAHSDFVSFDGEFAVNGEGEKSLKVAPTFDVKNYFFENDYVKPTELSVTPAYKYVWTSIPSNGDSSHIVSLSAAAKFAGPYETEVGLDLKDFVSAEIAKDTKVTGNVGIYAKKGFGLYENGNHSIDLGLKGGYKLSDFAWSENAKYVVEHTKGVPVKPDVKTRLKEDKLYLQPVLTYNYKINDYSKLYTALETELAGTKDYRVRDTGRVWTFGSSVKAGLKVSF